MDIIINMIAQAKVIDDVTGALLNLVIGCGFGMWFVYHTMIKEIS